MRSAGKGCARYASIRHISRHGLTTAMQHLVEAGKVLRGSSNKTTCSTLCKRPPSIPLSFNLAAVLLRRGNFTLACLLLIVATNISHWSGHGLLGSLIPFASHAFVPKRLSCLVGRLLYWLAPAGHRIATLCAESFQPLHNTKRNGHLHADG